MGGFGVVPCCVVDCVVAFSDFRDVKPLNTAFLGSTRRVYAVLDQAKVLCGICLEDRPEFGGRCSCAAGFEAAREEGSTSDASSNA